MSAERVFARRRRRVTSRRPLALIIAVATSILLVLAAGGAPASADVGDTTFVSTPAPVIDPGPTIGRYGYASVNAWSPQPDSTVLEWFDGGTQLGACTGDTYCLVPDDLGGSLTLEEIGSKAGYVTASVTSAAVTILGKIIPGAVTVSGTQQVGQLLTASEGTWTPSDVTLSYQWESAYQPIPGATSSSYTLTEADSGRAISLNVVATMPGFASAKQEWNGDFVYPSHFTKPWEYIEGTDAVGSTLTLAPNWFPTPDAVTYQWQDDGVDIPGATGLTYVVQTSDLGQTIDFETTATSTRLPTSTWSSPPTPKILLPFDTITTPVITGTPVVGVPLHATVPAWTPAASAYELQWFVNGTPVPYTGSATYTPTASNLGASITVLVIGYSATRATATSPLSAPSRPVAESTFKLGTVKIGTVDLNRTVGATFTKPPASATLSYQWLINGSAIAGATKSTYLPEGSTWHKNLSVRITVSGSGYTTSVGASNSELVRNGTLEEPDFPLPQIVPGEQVRVGATLHAESVGWNIPGLKIRYKWLDLNAGPMDGTYGSSYTVKSADDHHKLYVFESVSAPHLKTLEWYGNDYTVNPGLISIHPIPLITGVVKVGSRLTAHPGSWSPSTVKLSYRWYRSGVAISGATRSTFTLTKSDLNRDIAVRVTGSKAGYTTVGESSAATAVAPGTFTKAATPTITGTPVIGSVLTSRRGTWSPSSSVSYGYQWLANGTPIAGATGAAYRLASRDAGNQISLRVTANKTAYTKAVRTSAPTAIILKKLTAGRPKITGTAKVGGKLTASVGTWTPGTTFVFTWYSSRQPTVALQTGDSSSYSPVAANRDHTIRVRVTGRLSGYAAALAYSAATGRVS
jgi:hypothetical protein